MKNFRNGFVLAAVIFLLPLACSSGYIGPDDELPAGFTADTEEGEGLFSRYCSSCHGLDSKGNPGLSSPNIRGKNASQISDAIATVALMQGLSYQIGSTEIEHIAAYLQWLVTEP